MMHVKKVEHQSEWTALLESAALHTFLQSWQWGEFQSALGETVFRLGVYDDSRLIGGVFCFVIAARRGRMLFCPHGPIFRDVRDAKEILKILTASLKEIAREEKCVCVRVSSLLIDTSENMQYFSDLGFRRAPTFMHPELAWILNIVSDEASLLAQMRKTTRYSIKKAEKDGVSITMGSSEKDVDQFYAVYRQTVDRQHFVPFSREYIEKERTAFAHQSVQFFFAHYLGEVISAAVIVFSDESAFYHHGASTLKYPKVPAAYLLQWHVILEAKRRGCALYNFWGIAPDEVKGHPWAGLSLFKKGFGGYAERYVPAQDLVLQWQYWIAYAIEWFRKKKRRL